MSQGGSVNSGFADNIAKQQKQLSQPFGMLTRRQKPAASEDGWQGTANHQVIRGCSMKGTALR